MKKVLITAARSPATLDLARQLHACGHTVFVADTTRCHICATSNAVARNFIVPSPRFDPVGFVDALIKIAEREQIDLIIPTCEEILPLSKQLNYFPEHCRVFSVPFDILHPLHNKWLFNQKLIDFGLDAPSTTLIKNPEDLKEIPADGVFALKPCYSRASQRIRKVIPKDGIPEIDIEAHNPWIAQEWIQGEKFCTYTICNQGRVNAHATYPVRHAIDNSSCLTFKYADHPKILKWVTDFVKKENFTGQIAFDFIERDDGKLFAIECNPRATHGVLLFSNKVGIDQAFFGTNEELITPLPESKKQIAMGMLMYGWRKKNLFGNLRDFVKEFFSTPDVVFNGRDLKPFLTIPVLFVRYFFVALRQRVPIPAAFTYDIDWNGEE